MANQVRRLSRLLVLTTPALLLMGVTAPEAHALQTGTITGLVTRTDTGEPLSNVRVSVQGTNLSTVTGTNGRYTVQRVPAGQHVLLFRQLGLEPAERQVTVRAGQTATFDVALEFRPVALGEVVVTGASRTPERVVEAPAAVAVVDPATARDYSSTGQAPRALSKIPGVDVAQSGMNDYNVNTRGFNSSLNRRVLVLQDGRDVSVAFLQSQEWPTLSVPLDDFARIEMVRGPGSALYGANAFSGVLALYTPPARDVQGTKLSLSGGELSSFQGDIMHAGVFGEGRFGYRANFGYRQSDTWSRSRTDSSAMRREYAQAVDTTEVAVPRDPEPIPLAGEDLRSVYGSARLDYYAPQGWIFTADGGVNQSENQVAVTGIGRVQIERSIRPWARLNWAHDNYHVMAWYTGRITPDPQRSLASGLALEETSALFHVEAQYNRRILDNRGRVVVGASWRNSQIDTDETLMPAAQDDRTDNYGSGYGQFEYDLVPDRVKLVAAGRVDESGLYTTQFSPKGAVLYTPHEDHSIRFTFNRAFQTPNFSEFFLQVPAGQPTTAPADLESGVETYFQTVNATLQTAVADLNLANDISWDFSAQTPVLALGNAELDVEHVNSWEVGYKGTIADRVYVTADFYISELDDFVTDLLPGVNPAFPQFALTDNNVDVLGDLDALEARIDQLEAGGLISAAQAAALRAPIPQLRAGHAQLDAALVQTNLLATLPDDSRAAVVSYTNAGEVTEGGIELGVGVQLTDEVSFDGTYSFFDFDVKEQALGDVLLPNTPKHKGTASLSYRGRQGLDGSVTGNFSDSFDWQAGVFSGRVPSRATFDVTGGYALNNYVRVHLTATNVFDNDKYHIFGGSVIGRRVLGGLTATF